MPTLLTDEQQFVQEAARDALGRVTSLERLRGALDGGELEDLWPTAVEAGWSGLLVSEQSDGAGLGAAEATLVMAELGRTLAEIPLLGHLVATGLLQRSGADAELLPALARGESRATVVFSDDLELSGEAVSGSEDWVIDAIGADSLLVVAGGRVALVDASAGGVSIDPHDRFDPSLDLARVGFDKAPARDLGIGAEDAEWSKLLAQLLLAASMTGTGRAALDLGVEYAKERYAFARPIGSFQSIKHGLVEVLRRLGLAEVLVRDAAAHADDPTQELRRRALAARVEADRAVNVATRTCMSVHGGIGVTWEHDAPLYFRRAQLSRRLLGGDDRAADDLAGALLDER
jgi:alkylation response protein AidB-like acyl-CoA dehydrogenase